MKFQPICIFVDVFMRWKFHKNMGMSNERSLFAETFSHKHLFLYLLVIQTLVQKGKRKSMTEIIPWPSRKHKEIQLNVNK